MVKKMVKNGQKMVKRWSNTAWKMVKLKNVLFWCAQKKVTISEHWSNVVKVSRLAHEDSHMKIHT